MDSFSLHTQLYFGENPLDALDVLKSRRVLVVTDEFLSSSGLLDRVTAHLGTFEVFSKVTPDPSLELVAQGVTAYRSFSPDAIVAFGGGSPMDAAKALRHFAAEGEGGPRPPLYCIPTTAGTGSEGPSFAVLTDSVKQQKYPLIDPALRPEYALLDPQFLEKIPPAVTADTGMDVLTHACEAYVSVRANPFTDAMAEKAFVSAWQNLPAAYRGDPHGKAALLLASCQGGMAFNEAGLGVCHALSHTLGGLLHQPHGRLNALLLPHVIRYNGAGTAAKKYGALAALCGLAPTAGGLASALARLSARLGEPAKFTVKFDREQVAAAALLDVCARDNPRVPTQKELSALLREVSSP
ncbi:MAG: iron-containing alcohol dehydrogenase [Oscillospiraceae bacterium]